MQFKVLYSTFTGYIFHKQIVSDTCVCRHAARYMHVINLYSCCSPQHTTHGL